MKVRVGAVLALLLFAGCDGGSQESYGVVSVSKNLHTLPAPAGHQLSSAVVAADGTVWVGSIDGGLSVLDPRTGRFHVLTERIAAYGTEVDSLALDSRNHVLWMKIGVGRGRLVKLDLPTREASLVRPPRLRSGDHTRFSKLDSRAPEGVWVDDFVLLPDGSVWVANTESPAGVYVGVNTPRPAFIEALEGRPYRRLVSNHAGTVWAISDTTAFAFDTATRAEVARVALDTDDIRDLIVRHEQQKDFGGAAAIGDQLWLAIDGKIVRRSGKQLERPPHFRGRTTVYEDVMAGTDTVILQTDNRFWATRGDDFLTLPSGNFFPWASATRLLGKREGLGLWVGSTFGLFSFDSSTQTSRGYRQPSVLPTAEPRLVVLRGGTRVWRRPTSYGPQRILRTQAGLLLATAGAPPAIFRPETGLWEPMPVPTDVTRGGHDIQLTTSTNDGVPILVTRQGIARWSPDTGSFEQQVPIDVFVPNDGILEVATDQARGIVILSCPHTQPFFGVDCQMLGYLPWGADRGFPIVAEKQDCLQMIDNGIDSWTTSDRQAVLLCDPADLLPSTGAVEVTTGVRESINTAIFQLINRSVLEFEALTPVSAALGVSWGRLEGRPAVFQRGEIPRPIEGAGNFEDARLDARRFAVDDEGNLCGLRPTQGESRARVECTNYFGRQVSSWVDSDGVLGSLRFARLRPAPSGRLWIDGLRGKVAWMERGDPKIRVVWLESAENTVVERRLCRIMGFLDDGSAVVDGRDVSVVEPTSATRQRSPHYLSMRRMWDRTKWPMAELSSPDEAGSRLIVGLPWELHQIDVEFGDDKWRIAQTPLPGQERSPVGPNVRHIVPAREGSVFWVGLAKGGAMRFAPGAPPVRYSTEAGLTVPTIAAMTTLSDSAIVATPIGLQWLDGGDGKAHAFDVPGLETTDIVGLASSVSNPTADWLYLVLGDGGLWRVTLARETGEEPDQSRMGPPEIREVVTLGTFGQQTIVDVAVLPAAWSSTETDDVYVATGQGLFGIIGASGAPTDAELRRIDLGEIANTSTMTAVHPLPDGRVVGAYFESGESALLVHDPTTLNYWQVTGHDRTQPIHALATLATEHGRTYLAARQGSTVRISARPLVEPRVLAWWMWLFIPGLLLAGGGTFLFFRRRDPMLARLRYDPEAVRELDLSMLPQVDTSLVGHRTTILAAAGVPRDCWDGAVALASTWEAVRCGDLDREALADRVADLIDAKLGDVYQLPGAGPGAWVLELPRLPINLPTVETTLLILFKSDIEAGFAGGNVDNIEAELGGLLRDVHQSMGTPFLLVTDLGTRVQLPTLVNARFPGVILGHSRLRDISLSDHPRRSLAQAILIDCWLDAISPYKSSGPVEDPTMFMGRERERRELISARHISAIICGGRRVGKTSLIRQLVRDLAIERPEMTVYEISLLGIRSYTDFVDRLERRIGLQVQLGEATEPPTGDTDETLSPALARIRRRRARRRDPSVSPEVIAAAVHEALEAHCVGFQHPPLLILDEIDGIASRDAASGYPLLSALHQLKSEGICSFVLVGFAELYRQTFDYDSPLYNFARVLQLGPLDEGAARRLVEQPLSRIGVEIDSSDIPDQLVEATAGFPNLIQFICDMLLRGLSASGRAVIRSADVADVLDFSHPASQPLSAYVAESFDQNVGRIEELLIYTMLQRGPRPCSLSDIGENLSSLGIDTDLAQRRAMVRRLKLVGVLKELPGETFDVAVPLLVQLLLAKDLQGAIDALVTEMQQNDM